MGWNIGLNAAGGLGAGMHALWLALLGVVIAMAGILIPSATLTYTVAQWGHKNRELRAVKAFKSGMAPIVVALLVATGWLLTAAHNDPAKDWPLWLLAAVSTVVVWRTKTHLLILLGIGAALGALGLI
jgi:chromate transporter